MTTISLLSVITRAEDEEIDHDKDILMDLRDNNCASNKTSAAIKQFNFFLVKYCEEKKFPFRATTIDQIPYEGLEGINGLNRHGPDYIQIFWSELMGSFFNYLAFHAYKFLKKQNGQISYESATGYASAIKMHFERVRFRHKPEIRFFSESNWRKFRNLLYAKHSNHCRKNGKKLTNPKIASSPDDRIAMARACFWLGNADSAEFHALNVMTFHLIGRGREVAVLTPDDLTAVRIDNDLANHYLISVSLQRDKEGPFQDLTLYPHQKSVEEDPYFSLIYSLLVGGSDRPHIFPTFHREASFINDNDKVESRVSALWNTCLSKLYKSFNRLSETLTEKLTCYHGRKGASQYLAESSAGGLPQVFRTGWQLRGVHTLFDYVISSKPLTDQAGRTLAGWSKKAIAFPPTLSRIKTNPELVNDFVMALFSQDIESRWSMKIRSVLTASIIRHYPDFIAIIEQHPNGNYECHSRHPFIHAVQNALRLAKVSENVFKKWIDEIRHGFASANFLELPINLLPPDLSQMRQIDGRSLIQVYNNLVSNVNSLFMQKMALEDDVSRLRGEVDSNSRKLARLESMVTTQNELLARIANTIEIKFNKPPPACPSQPQTLANVRFFTDSMKVWTKNITIDQMFVKYFEDQMMQGYELELKSHTFKTLLKSEKEKIKGTYKRLKRTVKTLLFYCDRFPPPLPDDPLQKAAWHREIKDIALQAKKLLIESIPSPPLFVSATFLSHYCSVNHLDSIKFFPSDTPPEILAHFDAKIAE
jgi:hypothetical protein